MAKAPTPWLQNKNKPQEELPEWAKRACINKAVSSGPSESAPSSPTVYVQVQQSPPQYSEAKQKQGQEQHPSPLGQQPKSQQPSPQCQQQSQQQKQNAVSAMPQQVNPQSHQHERVIPIRVSCKKFFLNICIPLNSAIPAELPQFFFFPIYIRFLFLFSYFQYLLSFRSRIDRRYSM